MKQLLTGIVTDYNGDDASLLTNDKSGINMHNEQWGSFVSKAAGGGASWYLLFFVFFVFCFFFKALKIGGGIM
jgi:hypothetical protein